MRVMTMVVVMMLMAGCSMWPFGHRAVPADPIALAEALRAGGYVLYVRHADTQWLHRDAPTVVVEDCATQRNLSGRGREQAHEIGAGLSRLLIPVGEVRSSPYCRCADTARLAFDRVLLDPDLATLSDASDTNRVARMAALRRLLATLPAPGTNTVIVAHADNFEAVGGPSLEEGEAAVVKPLSDGGFQVISLVSADAWSGMPIPPAGNN
jgi:phosphohistidine phosphatase SixA